MVEVELPEGLAAREAGGADPTFAAEGVAGGDLTLQAGDQILLMPPGLGAGPLGVPAGAVPERRGGRSGELPLKCRHSRNLCGRSLTFRHRGTTTT